MSLRVSWLIRKRKPGLKTKVKRFLSWAQDSPRSAHPIPPGQEPCAQGRDIIWKKMGFESPSLWPARVGQEREQGQSEEAERKHVSSPHWSLQAKTQNQTQGTARLRQGEQDSERKREQHRKEDGDRKIWNSSKTDSDGGREFERSHALTHTHTHTHTHAGVRARSHPEPYWK